MEEEEDDDFIDMYYRRSKKKVHKLDEKHLAQKWCYDVRRIITKDM